MAIGDDYIRLTFRQIRQAYHSAVKEWVAGDMVALMKCLLDADKKTRDLMKYIGEKDERAGEILK